MRSSAVAVFILIAACTSTPERPTDPGTTETTTTSGVSASGTEDAGETPTTTGPTTTEPTATEPTATDSATSDTGDTTAEPVDVLPWTYIAALDEGIRDDDYGGGAFQAARQGYLHSGIDYHMPVGTALHSPCDGVYLADYDAGYGNWVQVICPIPAAFAGDASVYASMLFAHLDVSAVATTGVDPGAAGVVTRGQPLGASGKTGNAAAAGILPHLHFEIALHGSELDGLTETHSSGNDADTPAAAILRDALEASCLAPTGLAPLDTSLALGRRIDPFILLSCLVADKPPLTAPADQPLHAWSDGYIAKTFDVDVGQ